MKSIFFRSLVGFISFLVMSGISPAEMPKKVARLNDAIQAISQPSTPGATRHEAMVALQEMKDASSIEALLPQIDWVSSWGSQTQRTTENTYPAAHALILIGEPSIRAAENYLRDTEITDERKLFLMAYVAREIFRIEAEDVDSADKKLIDWLIANYNYTQLSAIADKRHFRGLSSRFETLPKPAPQDGGAPRPVKPRSVVNLDNPQAETTVGEIRGKEGVKGDIDDSAQSKILIWLIVVMLAVTSFVTFLCIRKTDSIG